MTIILINQNKIIHQPTTKRFNYVIMLRSLAFRSNASIVNFITLLWGWGGRHHRSRNEEFALVFHRRRIEHRVKTENIVSLFELNRSLPEEDEKNVFKIINFTGMMMCFSKITPKLTPLRRRTRLEIITNKILTLREISKISNTYPLLLLIYVSYKICGYNRLEIFGTDIIHFASMSVNPVVGIMIVYPTDRCTRCASICCPLYVFIQSKTIFDFFVNLSISAEGAAFRPAVLNRCLYYQRF